MQENVFEVFGGVLDCFRKVSCGNDVQTRERKIGFNKFCALNSEFGYDWLILKQMIFAFPFIIRQRVKSLLIASSA